MKTDFFGNDINQIVGFHQQLFCLFDAVVNKVFNNADTHFALKIWLR